MSGTEILKGRPTWAEVTTQGAAFALNFFNLWTPAPITDVMALTMSVASGAFTGLERADMTTREKSKKLGALMEGMGVMVANRGLAIAAVGIATQNQEMILPGVMAFQAGALMLENGYKWFLWKTLSKGE